MVTRKPPRTPCKMTAPTAATPSIRTQWRGSTSQSHAARIIVKNPTVEAIKRCVCSKKIPPIHFEAGKRNMLYPKVVGQSGTARPTPLLVTMPPLHMRNRVVTAVNQAKRFSQMFDFGSDLTFIETTKINHRCGLHKIPGDGPGGGSPGRRCVGGGAACD